MTKKTPSPEPTNHLETIDARQKVLIFVAGVAVLATMAFYLTLELWEVSRLVRQGLQTTGTVLRCKHGKNRRRCQIRWLFNKALYRHWVSPGFLQNFKKGDSVTVRWFSHKPHEAQVALFSDRLTLGLTAFFLALIGFLYWILRARSDSTANQPSTKTG